MNIMLRIVYVFSLVTLFYIFMHFFIKIKSIKNEYVHLRIQSKLDKSIATKQNLIIIANIFFENMF